MKTRLLQETSCVHGYFQDCTFKTDDGLDCPGGTSREVTVDYEAAYELLNAEMRHFSTHFEFSEQQAEAIVNAALEGL